MANQTIKLHLRTGRDGALSALGHNLDFRVGDVNVTREDTLIRAVVQVSSIEIVGVVKGEAVDESEPSQKDRSKIMANLYERVLRINKFPTAVFEGNLEGEIVRGNFTLCGVTRPLNLAKKNGMWHATIHQPDFGIEPYSAMMGQLRVAPHVEVILEVEEASL